VGNIDSRPLRTTDENKQAAQLFQKKAVNGAAVLYVEVRMDKIEWRVEQERRLLSAQLSNVSSIEISTCLSRPYTVASKLNALRCDTPELPLHSYWQK
jgi:hypothetical protein